MILWIILFILVLIISYVLAAKSMKDFTQTPASYEYGLFLIRQTRSLNEPLLNLIRQDLQQTDLAVSFERLFKGRQKALAVFGPRIILSKFSERLNLLELEDYTNVDKSLVTGWEVEVKNSQQIPLLEQQEHLWRQLIVSKEGSHIRCLVVSDRLAKLSKAHSNEQLLKAYQKRSFPKEQQIFLNTKEILKLLWL